MKTQLLKKPLSAFLAAAVMFTTLPGRTLKAKADSGTLSITGTSGGCSQDPNGNITISKNGSYTITGDGSVTTNTVTVTVCTANVTLKTVDIDVSGISDKCAFSIASGASVNLTLSGANTLKSGESCAGLQVPEGAEVSITGGASDSLMTTGGEEGAGIGGKNLGAGGKITISGGTVNATGGEFATGIGGGNGGAGSSLMISGGTITATGGSYSCDIGSGAEMGLDHGTTTITGGTVKVSSVQSGVTDGNGHTEYCVTTDAASIGPNQTITGSVNNGPSSDMQTDSNGKLYFWMPASGSAAVKSGGAWYSASVSNISGPASASLTAMKTLNITDGSITASDGTVTQGSNTYRTNDFVITQSGSDSTQHTISVTGGKHSIMLDGVNIDVSSVSNKGAFVISNYESSANVMLAGTNVLKSGGNYAGIEVSGTTTLTVDAQNGAKLEVTGGQYGAGIGGGGNCFDVCGTIIINGGDITAHGGGGVNQYGAGGTGIGGGFAGAEGTVTISGGTVTAKGYGGHDIGDGAQHGGRTGTTTITGGSVKAGNINGPTNGSVSAYNTTLTLPSGSSVQSLAVKQGGASYNYGYKDMQTDNTSNGKLYLWLPANDNTTADLKTDGGSYSGYYGTVKTDNASVLKMNQSALSVGINSSYTMGEPIPVSATGGSGNGGVTYDYKSSSGTDFGAVQPTAPGDYTVTATKAGDDCYYPATSVQQNFAIIAILPTVTSVSPSNGTAGTSVTITGTNLLGATAVQFGGNAAADYTINSNTSITASAPAGSGTVDITVTAPNGTSAVSAADRFTYDSSDATLSGLTVSPCALKETFSSSTFQYTANAGVDVSEVTVTPTVSESHATFQVNGSSPAEGQTGVTVALSSTDITTRIPIEVTAQNGASKTYYITVTKSDPAKPVIRIDSNGYVGGAWTKNNVRLDISNTTQNFGTTTFEYSTDGTNWLGVTGGSVTDSTEGVTTYSFRATSRSGVQSDVQSITAKIDKTAPETHKVTIAGNDFTTFLNTITFGLFFKNTQTATVTAHDSGSGVASVRYQLVHNQSDYNEGGTWTDYPSGGISMNTGNQYIVYALITDNAGNSVIVNSNGVIVDQTSPELLLSAFSGWQTSKTLTVGVTADDNLAGVQSVTYRTDEATPQTGTVTLTNGSGNITLNHEGDYNLTVTAVDNAGNPVSKTAHIQWDKTAPTITSSNNPLSPVQAATLTVNASSGVSGIKSVTVSKDNGPAQDITGSYHNGYMVTANGTYIFTVMNNAGVGVSSLPVVVTKIKPNTTTNTVTNADAVKPVFAVDSKGYQNGTWTDRDVTLDVSNAAQVPGTITFEYSTNGTNWLPLNGGSITDSTEGITNYFFRAVSQSGIVSDIQSFLVKIDKTAPVGMTIGFQQNTFKTVAHFITFGLFFNDTVNVNFSASDQNGSGVDYFQYQMIAQGGAFHASDAWRTGPLSISPDYKGTIYARAVDKAGNVSGIVIKSLVVDKTAPVITAQAVLATNDPDASIPVEIKDNGAGVGSVGYQVNGGKTKTFDLTAAAYRDLTKDDSFTICGLPDGIYDVTVNSQDNSGNASATATVHVVKNAVQTGFGFTSGALSKTWGDAPFPVAATGGQSGGNVTYAVTSGPDVLSMDNATGEATIKKAGTAVITATKAAGNGYSAATAQMKVNVSRATPMVQVLPAASGISVIGKLSSSSLTGGCGSVAGSFAWTNPGTVVTQSGSYAVTFTPADSDHYNTVSCDVSVTVTPLLTGGGSGTKLDFTGAALPAGVTSVVLSSTVQIGSNSICSAVKKIIGQNRAFGNLGSLTVYDLKLLDQNGNPVKTFTGKIKVKVPIPAGMTGNLEVLWYNPAGGTLTNMNAVQENGYLVFETGHFSYYAVAQLVGVSFAKSAPVQNQKTGSGNWPFYLLTVLGVSAAIGAVIVKRRRFIKLKKKT